MRRTDQAIGATMGELSTREETMSWCERIVRSIEGGPKMSETYDEPNARGIKATPRALLVQRYNGDEQWVPQSAIHDDSEVYKPGTDGKLVVDEWFARSKGWL